MLKLQILGNRPEILGNTVSLRAQTSHTTSQCCVRDRQTSNGIVKAVKQHCWKIRLKLTTRLRA